MQHHSTHKAPSQRQLRVGEELRQALSGIFMKEDFYISDTHELVSVTISEARVSPDLRNATIYYMPLGGKNREKTTETLNNYGPQIRTLLSKLLRLRFVPVLTFRLDTTFDQASALDSVLKREDVRRDIEKPDDSDDNDSQTDPST